MVQVLQHFASSVQMALSLSSPSHSGVTPAQLCQRASAAVGPKTTLVRRGKGFWGYQKVVEADLGHPIGSLGRDCNCSSRRS